MTGTFRRASSPQIIHAMLDLLALAQGFLLKIRGENEMSVTLYVLLMGCVKRSLYDIKIILSRHNFYINTRTPAAILFLYRPCYITDPMSKSKKPSKQDDYVRYAARIPPDLYEWLQSFESINAKLIDLVRMGRDSEELRLPYRAIAREEFAEMARLISLQAQSMGDGGLAERALALARKLESSDGQP
jgi:hypothetical protein